MGTPLTVTEGSYVWVEDASLVWTDGQVLKIQGEEVEIQCEDGNTVVSNILKLYPKDMEASPAGVDDMTKLLYLHEPGVLNNLASRYELNQIYTYTGNILISVNPFERLPHLYDSEMMERYKGAPFGKMSPHVFAVADAAYRAMMDEGKSNSVLVSGESGAGKTETTKMLMRYLAFLGGHAATEGRTVEQQVLESNPVLEAFGNAKTARNNNSSRFGKFVELQFDKRGKISGAAIRTYLLERSRVCQISGPERNYHCFYLLCAAPKEETEKYKLGNPTTFHYLNQSNCYEVVGLDDAESYIATRRAMSIIGMSDQEQNAIFRVVAAILHLGNINFANNGDVDSSLVTDESKFHLQMTAELLMCDIQKLQDALCTRVMVTPEEIIKRSLDPDAATVSRDGMAKTIYSRLFDWLVSKINVSIGQDHTSKSLIGILDIYGFESFQSNSFEQFCINYTNEKLQQNFNQHVFKSEQEEYIKEEIEWSYIEFVDNQDILDLIEKKPGGIMALLDEACMFPKSTHETFSQKLYQTFRYHKRFVKPKRTRTDFSIVHYAGEVQYQSDQFLDKNKDYVVPEHQDLLSASNCSFVSGLFPPLPEETTAKSSKFSSISSRFKLQLQQLVDTLKSTEPHYIRCVKPNNLLKPVTFDNINVMQQLRSGGVLEAIRISCAGYPTRKTFSEFLTRFRILRPELLQKKDYDEKETCKRILEMMGLTGYQIGNTKVLLRAGQMAELDAQRAAVRIGSARTIQKQGRSYVVRKDYSSLRKASIHIQTFIRGILACEVYKQMRREAASVVVQSYFRGHVAVTNYARLKFSAVILQAGLRGVAARSLFRYRRKTYAATKIQASFRGHKSYSDYKKLKAASLESQSTSSETQIGIDDNNDTMETDTIRETKNKLEQQLDILTCDLQSERRLRTDLEQSKGHEITQLQDSLKAMQNKVDETNALLVKERQAAKNVVEEWSMVKECPVQDSENIGMLASEVENLKALLRSEKRRTDDLEKKYAEALDLSEERHKKLEEAERKVQELQESLDRMLYSMCNQVSQLKMIFHTPSISISTSSSFARVEQVDANSSDASSTGSDFTFPAPVPTAGTFSSFDSNGLQLIVQEISSDTPGSENWHGEREGAFDDFF